jgi:hypothetical protein
MYRASGIFCKGRRLVTVVCTRLSIPRGKATCVHVCRICGLRWNGNDSQGCLHGRGWLHAGGMYVVSSPRDFTRPCDRSMYCDTMPFWPCSASILQSSPSFVLQFELHSAPKRYRSASRNPRIWDSCPQTDTPPRYAQSAGQVWASALDVADLCGPRPSTSSLPTRSHSTAITKNNFHASYPAIAGISSLQDRVTLRNISTRQISSSEAACRTRQSPRVVYLFSDRLELANSLPPVAG